jgi:tetratricopeptide (TPR) repeat protein
VIGRRIGRFLVVSKLGQGGFATVWRARDELLGRAVALKVMDEGLLGSPKARRRFLHDAQAAAALEHPGIVAVYETGESDGLLFMALQLVDGVTLSEHAARRLLPLDEAVRIVAAAAEALAHAHARGVIHRDVTGRNIMVAGDGRVFVLDFGLALAAWQSRLTSTETAVGTAHYMAPELIRGERADARSDLYGLGVVLYEALTGTFPFPGDQPPSVFYSSLNLAPVPPSERRPEIPAALERVVLKAIARDPLERYQSAEELVAALRGLDPGAPAHVESAGIAKHLDGRLATSPAFEAPAPAGVGERGAPPTFLAVLPFEAVESSADPENACAALASRLAETLSAALSRSPGVRVVPPPVSPLPAEPREVAQRLGANLLLRGSVRRSGSQLRVSYALLDPWRGVQVGGDVVDGSALRIFDVEDQVVASLLRALRLESGADAARPSRPGDPAAADRYLQALNYLKRYDSEAAVDGAIKLLEGLIASEGESATYCAALARAFLHKQEHTKQRVWESRAAAACERAMRLAADAPEVRVALGRLQIATGRYDDAVRAFEEALRLQPDSLDAVLGVCRAKGLSGRLDEAEAAARQAVRGHPGDWRGHSLLGWVLFQKGAFAEALAPWRRVVELTPDNARGRRNLGSAHYRLDRLGDAVTAYQESLAIQPNDEAYSNLGTALYVLGRHAECIVAFRRAAELTPLDPVRWGNLGIACRWIAGHEADAPAALDRAIGLMRERLDRNPAQAEWWALLAGWLADRGLLEEAGAAIRRALELDPHDVECMIRAGHVYFQLGDRAESIRWFGSARRAGCGVLEFRRSPALAALREDPEFRRLLEADPTGRDANDVPGSHRCV